MKHPNLNPRSAALVAAGIVSMASMLHAEDTPTAAGSTNQPTATPAPPAPLMAGLGSLGLAEPLNKVGVNVYGYAQAGYLRDFNVPSGSGGPTYLGFNGYKNTFTLDKVSLNLERTVDPTKKQFDVGFHAEGIYGSDAKFIHSNGAGDTQTDRYQWDPLQAYVDIALPGLPAKIRVGKWIELAGFEHFSANIYGAFSDPARALYSYSYQFLYAEPGTQTGILGTYVLNPQVTLDAGITLGWNESLRASHDSVDFLGRLTYTPNDKTSITFVMTEGPEYPTTVGEGQPKHDTTDFWTALDLVVTRKINDNLSLGLGFDYVYAPRIPAVPGTDKQWGGVAQYLSYALDSHFTLNTRLEWYRDAANGFSTGAPVSANCYEATVGVAIKPLPNHNLLSHLLIRPEVRLDYADARIFGGTEHSQLTFSVDALYTF